MSQLYDPNFAHPLGAVVRKKGYVIFGTGVAKPTDATPGYAKKCLFIDTTAGVFYVNDGTVDSCSFVAVASLTSGAFTTLTADSLTVSTTAALSSGAAVTLGNSAHITLGTGTGTKIGTGTGQKCAFFNAAPVAQQNTTGTTAGFTSGSGTTAKSDSTYSGGTGTTAYTNGDVVLALKNLGFLAQ